MEKKFSSSLLLCSDALSQRMGVRPVCLPSRQAGRRRESVPTDRQTDRQIDRQIDGWIDRWTGRQMDKQTDRQMDRWTDRDRQIHGCIAHGDYQIHKSVCHRPVLVSICYLIKETIFNILFIHLLFSVYSFCIVHINIECKLEPFYNNKCHQYGEEIFIHFTLHLCSHALSL